VLAWNGADDTLACLTSLAAAQLGGARVIVVDNGSRDGTIERVRAEFPSVAVLALPENRGFAGGNNAGITAALDAGAEGVLLLNNDARVAPDFLPPLLDAIASRPRCAAASSAVFRLDRPELIDVAYVELRFDLRSVVQIMGVNALPGEGYDTRREVEVAVGTALLLRAEALREVGLLDEAYFAYHEDVDWCIRARQAGYEMFYEPYSRVYHLGSSSTRALRRRPAPLRLLPEPGPDLPNAEAMPWNPVRAYLGARNTVRLLRRYATPQERKAFTKAFLRSLPLEFTAVMLDREGWMKLGRWTWGELAQAYLLDRHGIARTRPATLGARLLRSVRIAWWAPLDVLCFFPRDVWRALRAGRMSEFFETLRGLRDGVLDRPLPLERLGLR